MSWIPSIALSYGIFQKPTGPEILEAAHKISCSILKELWESGFAKTADRREGDDVVDLYNVNVPLVPSIVDNPLVRFTSLAPARYGRLFSVAPKHSDADQSDATDSSSAAPISELNAPSNEGTTGQVQLGGKLRFEFSELLSRIERHTSTVLQNPTLLA
jgi:tubulin--tyrosine ligase